MIYERFRNEFSALSSVQLKEVARALQEATESRQKQEIDALREEFQKKAQELGVTFGDIAAGGNFSSSKDSSKRVGKKVDPKYRIVSSDGTVCEWSGRGIKPKAFAAYSKEEIESRFSIPK